jgi:hypothetical protein
MTVDAVVYFRVIDPASAVVRVENYLKATSLISQTTLRSVLGQAELDELLSQRDKINLRLPRAFRAKSLRRPVARTVPLASPQKVTRCKKRRAHCGLESS